MNVNQNADLPSRSTAAYATHGAAFGSTPSILTTDRALPRALSLRNLVLGYGCGRIYPAGVGPGSTSRDVFNRLSCRFSRSVETRRRYDWLRMVFPGARLFRAPIWCPSGGGATREKGSTVVAERMVALYRVTTHQFSEGGRQLDRRRGTAVLNSCARESKARTGRFLREKRIPDQGLFSSYEDQQEVANG